MSEIISHETSHAKRKKMLLVFMGFVISLGIGIGVYWIGYASRFVSTDNAYTAVEIAQVTPSVGGTIQEIYVTDTEHVKTGDILVKIDPTDAKIILEQAHAELDQAIRRVRGYKANNEHLRANITAKEADKNRIIAQLNAAKADLERASLDLKRREILIHSGSVSNEELTRMQNIYTSSKANVEALNAMVQEVEANLKAALYAKEVSNALIDKTTDETHPEVIAARARVDQATIDLERTVLRSPVDGIISKRQVQLGQRVQQGTYLLSIVPIDKMYVNANFKEGQLKKVQPNQQVSLYADLYGKEVVYHGVVEGFSGGTGSAFAAIPAQNATGNWIKVVQRVPVKIRLDEKELKANPLRVGLSMNVEIDTSAFTHQE